MVRCLQAHICQDTVIINCCISIEPCAVLCFCCHRLQNGQDEGRDAFKSLKNQQIADKAALLYTQWADLEVKTGTVRQVLQTQLSLT